ncbi:MAG: hypothetical protein K6A94_12030 [Bacteroidales bacterium]|nr:hypothetical protein [Bacteroidales bacterium]
MKPTTKKILIIVAAVLVVAAIVYFVFIRKGGKNSTASIISKLDTTKDVKDALTSMVDIINTTWDDAHKQAISDKATANGRTLAQQTVIEADYALWSANQIDDATYNSILNQVLSL